MELCIYKFLRLTRIKVLLYYSSTGKIITKNNARSEGCDRRAWRISAPDLKKTQSSSFFCDGTTSSTGL